MFVNRLQRQGFRLLITGSNANLLSSELATHLTGRHASLSCFPFLSARFWPRQGENGPGSRKWPHWTCTQSKAATLTGIPLEAYDYIVNGKPALDWVVERQCVKTDKDSGIVNDANDWAVETMKNPLYPLELFQRVITVSLETMKIVRSLPGLAI
jgi:Type ISP C-terminal specificity domain/AAA domain